MDAAQLVEMVTVMSSAAAASCVAGGLLGGFVYSLGSRVWDHLADRIAERTNRKLEEEVLQLRGQCWRLRARNKGRGV